MVAEKKSGTALEPFQKEENWLAISITLAIIAAVLGGFGLLWIFDLGPIEKIDDRIKVATLVGTGLLALITYSTVVWRGLVGARQADQQKDENTAKLLLEGAKLLSESKIHQISAGTATLTVVLRSQNDTLQKAAMDVLADFIIEHWDDNLKTQAISGVNRAMLLGKSSGFTAMRRLDVKSLRPSASDHVFHGFKEVRYSASDFYIGFDELGLTDENILLRNCEISDVTVDCRRQTISSSNLYNCKFRTVNFMLINNNKFFDCDFSDAQMNDDFFGNLLPSLNFQRTQAGCFYFEGSPPLGKGSDHMISLLYEKPRPAT
jgi:hypothetical protein